MLWLHLLFWLLFTALFAYGQGLLMPAIRLTPPGREALRQSFALHWLFGAVWFAPAIPWAMVVPWWCVLVVALGTRFVVFDSALNAGAGDPVFHVGRTANSDKLLQAIAARFGLPVSVLSAGLKGAALVLLGVVVFHYKSVVMWINNW